MNRSRLETRLCDFGHRWAMHGLLFRFSLELSSAPDQTVAWESGGAFIMSVATPVREERTGHSAWRI